MFSIKAFSRLLKSQLPVLLNSRRDMCIGSFAAFAFPAVTPRNFHSMHWHHLGLLFASPRGAPCPGRHDLELSLKGIRAFEIALPSFHLFLRRMHACARFCDDWISWFRYFHFAHSLKFITVHGSK